MKLENLTAEEVCEKMGISLSTLKNHYQRTKENWAKNDIKLNKYGRYYTLEFKDEISPDTFYEFNRSIIELVNWYADNDLYDKDVAACLGEQFLDLGRIPNENEPENVKMFFNDFWNIIEGKNWRRNHE